MEHGGRIEAIATRFDEAMARFQSRLARIAPDVAERAPDGGGWSPAQVVWHVAAVNEAFLKVVDGSAPVAQPRAADFVEREWSAIGSAMPAKLEAPARVQPPAVVAWGDALEKLTSSAARFSRGFRALDADRARLTYNSMLGPITVYQVGEWAAAHVIRHNKQVKRLLGEG